MTSYAQESRHLYLSGGGGTELAAGERGAFLSLAGIGMTTIRRNFSKNGRSAWSQARAYQCERLSGYPR
jgi:hypothetical protein